MHVRHEAIFRWIQATFAGGKLYGPYHHDGRHYFQWMARGPYLRDSIVPLCDRALSPTLDGHSYERYVEMKRRYAGKLGPSSPESAPSGPASPASGLASLPADDRPLPPPPGGGDGAAAIFAQLRQAAARLTQGVPVDHSGRLAG
jgi:hypothetical protein